MTCKSNFLFVFEGTVKNTHIWQKQFWSHCLLANATCLLCTEEEEVEALAEEEVEEEVVEEDEEEVEEEGSTACANMFASQL